MTVRAGWGRRTIRDLIGITILAMVGSLFGWVTFAPPATASPTGNPAAIINYNTVPGQYIESVRAFEQHAVDGVLGTHALPASDAAAVKGWARNDVRAQMWADLLAIIKKPAASRTPMEADVYSWFQRVVQQQNIKAANASIQEYLKYSGHTLGTYLFPNADPLNYNGTTVENSTAGYCLYDPPEPYAEEFNPSSFQACNTAPGIPVEFLAPGPTFQQFVKYGQYVANRGIYETQDFDRTSFEVAATVSLGVSMGIAGVAVPLTIALTAGIEGGITIGLAVLRAVFPFTVRLVQGALQVTATALGVGIGAATAAVGTVILAIVSITLASIQLNDQLTLPSKLRALLDAATDRLPNLDLQLADDDRRANDESLSDEEQAPKYYPGYYAIFLGATLPEAFSEPCVDSGISGGVFDVGCVNAPSPAPARWTDPAFAVTEQAGGPATEAQSIEVKLPDSLGSQTTRLSGNGWFVNTAPSGTMPTTQSLRLYHVDWDGNPWIATRIYDEEHGYRFVRSPIGPDAEPEECEVPANCVSDTLKFTRPDGSRASVRVVAAPPTPTIHVTGPAGAVEPYTDVSFSATSDPQRTDLTYQWLSSGYCTEGITITCTSLREVTNPLTGLQQYMYVVDGPSSVQQFGPGTGRVTLVTTNPTGFRDVQTIEVPVNPAPPETKVPDLVTIDPITFDGIGDTGEVSAHTQSGIPLTLSVQSSGVCTLDGTTISTLKAGICYVVAQHSGSDAYKPVYYVQVFEVPKIPQTLAWSFPPPGGLAPSQTTTLSATATSGLPVIFRVQYASRNVCSISGTTLTALTAGVCSVNAEQVGTDQWRYVSTTKSVTVGKKSNAISWLWFQPTGVKVGDTITTHATSLALLPVTVTVDDASAGICSKDGSVVTALAVGTCSLTARQPGNEAYEPAPPITHSFAIAGLNQAITVLFFPPDGGIEVGDTLFASASSNSLLTPTITVDEASAGICSYAGTTLTALKPGTCSFTARQAGNSTFNAATPVTRSVEINRKVQGGLSVLWFPPPSGLVYGDSLFISASSLLLLPVTLSVDAASAGVCSLSGTTLAATGIGTCSVTARQAGNDEYEPAQTTVSVAVVKAKATVHVASATVQYSDALPNLNVVDHVSGLVGGDSLAGSLTGCTAAITASGKVTSGAGSYPVTGCSGMSNGNYDVAYSGSVSVTPENASLSYDNGYFFATGSGGTGTATMTASLKQSADGAPGDPAKVKVDFLLFKSTNLGTVPDFKMQNVSIGSNGSVTVNLAGLPADFYHVLVRQSGGSGFFTATEAADDITVYTPVAGTSASGGGWVVDPNAGGGKKGHFGISVSINKQKVPTGEVTYRWIDATSGFEYVVRSNSWSGGAALIDKKTATLTAKANLTVVNPATRAVVPALSGGNYSIKVVATDGGSTDTFAVTIKSPAGTVVKQVGPLQVSGGNITVKS